MDEIIKTPVEEPEQLSLIEEDEETAAITDDDAVEEDPLKHAIEAQLRKIQRQNMLIGAQTMCTVILEKIMVATNQPGKRTMNDYKRLIKDIESFCRTGLSRRVKADGEVELVEEESTVDESNDVETVQN